MSSSARATTPAAVLDRLRPDVWVKGGHSTSLIVAAARASAEPSRP
jgi:bifunctional ADP-heptose synthase (sugar kinase/adenylyltransferase)